MIKSSSMDGETAANFSSCPSDIMVVKVYGEPETPSTLYTPTSSSFVSPCGLGTSEHSSRYHRNAEKARI